MTTTDVWKQIQPKLQDDIIQCLESNFNFTSMMPVQKASIPLFLKHYDVAVEAQTGSGKTLAFLIPIFNNFFIRLKQLKKTSEQQSVSQQLYATVIVPTRELATQIAQVANIFAQNLSEKISIQLCIGGYPIEKDIEKIQEQGCNILIGSPGKLRQLFQDGKLKELLKFVNFEYLIFDEADRLINNDYAQDLSVILDQLPKQRRTGIFSATLREANTDFAKLGLRNPVKIQIKTEQEEISQNEKQISIPKTLKNYYYVTLDRTSKFTFLINYLCSRQSENLKIILFFNTCASAEYYHLIFQSMQLHKKFNLFCMHGKQKQKKRINVYNKFKELSQKSCILITTNIVARGIDIADIQLVIQFDPPQDPSFFVHRVGRTARSGKEGEALILLEKNEEKFIKFLERKDIKLDKFHSNISEIQTFENIQTCIQDALIKDRNLIEKSKQAFVSFIRSYKEHKLQLIFQLNELNIGKVAYSFFLLRLPRVKEILGKKIDFKQSEINPFEIEFQDKNQQKQFNEKKLKKEDKFVEKKQHKISFHNKYMGKDINVKNTKSLRKKIKNINNDQELFEMEEELRLVKKLKKGLITKQQFKERMKDIDPLEVQSDSDT